MTRDKVRAAARNVAVYFEIFRRVAGAKRSGAPVVLELSPAVEPIGRDRVQSNG